MNTKLKEAELMEAQAKSDRIEILRDLATYQASFSEKVTMGQGLKVC